MDAAIGFLSRGLFSFCNDDDDDDEPSTMDATTTWVKYLARLNHMLAGSLLHLCFRLIDIVLLFLGLYLGRSTCAIYGPLSILSILLIIVGGIDLILVVRFLIRYLITHNETLSDELLVRYKSSVKLRHRILFIKLIITCVATGFVVKSTRSSNKECEITRFYLGIVCFSTWTLFCFRLPKPASAEKPVSFIVECITFPLTLIFNCFYFGFVGFAMIKIQDTKCIYTDLEDLYYRAPLKSFAYIGFILISCKTVLDVFTFVLSLLYLRYRNWRLVLDPLLCVRYMLFYAISLLIVYYLSVGAILLFEPRSGSSCRWIAPQLYKTLLIFQWIRVFWPLAVLPLFIILLCSGSIIAGLLVACLPACVTVPSLEVILDQAPEVIPSIGVSNTSHSSATTGNSDASPLVVFGQEPDPLNQTECAICRENFETNEQVNRLQCGHFFHAACVTRWLVVIRICPMCRQRVVSTNL